MAVDLDGPNSAINVNTIETYSGSTLTIGKSGDTVSLGAGASASGFTKEGAITWDSSIKTANTSITSGAGFFVDTTSAALTITLPASPSVGNIVGIKDYAGTFGTNNLTIARNGSNIQGSANDSTISTNRASVVLVYADATRGWLYTVESNVGDLQTVGYVTATGGTITTSGDYKIHTFNSSGTFTVTDAGNPLGSNTVDYMVIAAGGGGQRNAGTGSAGGGGAGGFRESVPSPAAWTASPLANSGGSLPVSAQAYPITVGGGGAGGSPSGNTGGSGGDSIFSTITSSGGGGGGSTPGGSGGGAQHAGVGVPNPGGSGNTPSVSPPQGNDGGDGIVISGGNTAGGGGGGAGAAGADGISPARAGNGGNGVTTSITASPTTYAGGGAGNGQTSNVSDYSPGNGGSGGGGNSPGGAGSANTGGGGGSNSSGNNGGAGGSGKVVIRYKFQN